MTIRQAITIATKKLQAKQLTSAQLDAEVLLSSVLKISREQLLTYPEKNLTTIQAGKFQRLIIRRAKYEPVAYLVGQKEFYGLQLKVNKYTLIPRPETEELVEMIVNINKDKRIKIIDLGTGSGAIALALKKELPQAKIIALDNSLAALKVARLNAKNNKLKVEFIKSDLLKNFDQKLLSYSVLAVNLPYVSKSEIKDFSLGFKKSLGYEPAKAIFAKNNGTEIYEKLFKQLNTIEKKYLPQLMLAEIGSHHYQDFLGLAKKYFPDQAVTLKKDLFSRFRFLIVEF
jgi:release factor glutamine methyltransferase